MSNQYEVLGKAPVAEDLKKLSPNNIHLTIKNILKNSTRFNRKGRKSSELRWTLSKKKIKGWRFIFWSTKTSRASNGSNE